MTDRDAIESVQAHLEAAASMLGILRDPADDRATAKRITAMRPGIAPNVALAAIECLRALGWRPPETRPPVLAAVTGMPGEALPPVPESCYPSGATPLSTATATDMACGVCGAAVSSQSALPQMSRAGTRGWRAQRRP